jgi:hypothetical protein
MSASSLITTPFGFDSTAAEDAGTGSGVASYAVDPTSAERLWELSQGTLA